MPKDRIFLSAVTGQFKECRDALRSDLAAVGAEVVVQEDFTQQGGTLLEKLEDYIATCDRLIALVGSAYGWEPEPTAAPPGAPPRSYTQWEYHLARGERLDGTTAPPKPVYVYFATPSYLEQHPVTQSDAEARRQREFVEAIAASGKDRNEFDSLDKLGRLVLRDGFKLSGSTNGLRHNLPYDSLGPLFKGREGVISEIRAQLTTRDGRATAVVAKQAIHGLGGVGKTRVAVEYAWGHIADHSACLFASADSPESLDRNLAALCDTRILDLPEQSAEEQEPKVVAVLGWLHAHPGWLLILDNVDTAEAATAVDRLLPSLQNGHVLITSRRTDWGDSIRTLALDTLRDEDAVAFLLEKTAKRRTHADDDAAAAHTLAQTLGGLALALEQAGAFINHKRISFGEYRERWERQEAKLRQLHDSRTYQRSLAVTWETSFEQLSSGAQALLNILSWFAPDPIPRRTIEDAIEPDLLEALVPEARTTEGEPTAPLDPEDLLDEIETLSLLAWGEENRTFTVHRLVQEITRTRLSGEARSRFLRAAIELIDDALPRDPPPQDVRAWGIWDPLRPHIEQLIRAADDAQIHEPTTQLMNGLGQYLLAKGLLREAEPLMRRALAIDEASFGGEHPNVAAHLNTLARLLQATNRLEEAEPLMRRALAIDEASFGGEHPNVAAHLNTLAHLLQATNRLEEAEPLMRRALAIDEASYGGEHPDVARDLNTLAHLLQATHRLEEAEPLMRRALAIDEASFGGEHPEVAVDLNNLAHLLQATNRLEEAEPLMRRALAIDEASYGGEHPEVAVDLNNLAHLLQATHRLEEAEPLMRRALAIDEASFGGEHPNVARDLNNLAHLLRATHRLEEAEPLMRRALAIDEASFGGEHPRVAAQLNNLAHLLQATNRLEEAEPLMRRALAIDEASYGGEHPDVARDLNNLAHLLQATNRLEEAEPLMRRVVEIFLRFTVRTGHEHPHLDAAIENYSALGEAMGWDEEKQQAMIDSLIESTVGEQNS